MPPLFRFLPIVLSAVLAAACDTTPVDREPEPSEAEKPESKVRAIPLEDTAPTGFPGAQDTRIQNLDQAIEADLREALDAEPPYRQNAYLDAAATLIEAGRLNDAETVLDAVITTGLAPVIAARKDLLRAQTHYRRDELETALGLVERALEAGNIDPTYTSRGLDLKGRIQLRREQPLAAARTWIRRDAYLTDERALAGNHERIWLALGRLDALQLQVAAQPGDAKLAGWLDLAILFLELAGDRHSLRTAVAQWRDANSFHPAADFAQRLLSPAAAPGVRRVALLLPLSSDYGAAARIVHDGFDAAHQLDSDPQRPRVMFYDIGGEQTLVGNYLDRAADDDADVVVGPLGKAAVSGLLEARQPQTPMLLLGNAETDQSPDGRHYQFALAPEAEARQVAEFMYSSGHRRVAALYPAEDWGRRLFRAFREHWRSLGGTLAEAQAYAPGNSDFTAPIENLFNLVESRQRRDFLESKSGLNLHFDAHRRQDIDALFMPARPEAARLLKPQIDFFQGHDLPVYSTSEVYTGTPDAAKDTDLDGIRFPEMPWLLRETARIRKLQNELESQGFSNASTRLFAFGFDAYGLGLAAARPDFAGTRAAGLTADLAVDATGRVHRRLDWARFQDGVPVRIWGD